MTNAERQHDIDWLRVLATYLLFVFHTAKVFDVVPFYHIKDAHPVPRLDALTLFVHLWHMPLFFVLAGWSIHASLRRRGSSGAVRERVRRLGVPFVAGIVLLCPVLKFFELRSGISLGAYGYETFDRPFDESFLAFLPTFFTLGRFTWSHLWFLLYLFTFTLLYRGLLVRMLERPPHLTAPSPARLYLPLLPLAAIQLTLRPFWPGVQNLFDDWANFAYYSLFFLLGFVLALRPRWRDVIDREWRRAGAIGLAASAVLVGSWLWRDIAPGAPSWRVLAPSFPLLGLTAVAGYCLIVAMLGLARRYLGWGGQLLTYLSESSLPVYVLHQAAIVVPGFFIIRLPLTTPAKFGLVLVVAVASTLVVYELLVRRIAVLRFLMGISREPVQPSQGGLSHVSASAPFV